MVLLLAQITHTRVKRHQALTIEPSVASIIMVKFFRRSSYPWRNLDESRSRCLMWNITGNCICALLPLVQVHIWSVAMEMRKHRASPNVEKTETAVRAVVVGRPIRLGRLRSATLRLHTGNRSYRTESAMKWSGEPAFLHRVFFPSDRHIRAFSSPLDFWFSICANRPRGHGKIRLLSKRLSILLLTS